MRPCSSQHTPVGEAINGSLATTSMRKPSGSLKAAALSSGVCRVGASVGCGICPQANCATTINGRMRYRITSLIFGELGTELKLTSANVSRGHASGEKAKSGNELSNVQI